jgi:para-aminobenzoate synthetase component 1
MRLSPRPYRADSADYFETLADLPWAVFLDSGQPSPYGGRYDILAADPWARLVTQAGETTLTYRGGGARPVPGDPLDALRDLLGARAEPGDLPFQGGALGYIAYDHGVRRMLGGTPAAARLPELAFGLYDCALVVDHGARRATLVSAGRDPDGARAWDTLDARLADADQAAPRAAFRGLGGVRRHVEPDAYRIAFDRLKHYIREGDCYQANLAMRFSVPVAGDPWMAYRRLRRLSPTPHAAYLNLPEGQILSASPERFLEARAGAVLTQPIKGTRRRGVGERDDAELARELAASPKDRAENLMIVDLLRNDLGKVCQTGSIAVPSLFEARRFANVHHLVSTVTGRLAPGRDALDLLRAAFPGGSITGAPKRRAMEIIAELEGAPRGVYCGSIGYIGHDGAMDSNIAIRTLTWAAGVAEYWAGGGIVADSEVDTEYRECLDKAAPFLRLFEETPGA